LVELDRTLVERSSLTDYQKKLIIIIDIEKKGVVEVAKILGKSKGTVSSQHKTALQAITKWVEGMDETAKRESAESNESAMVIKLLEQDVRLPQISVQTHLSPEKVELYTDKWVKLKEKDRQIAKLRRSTGGVFFSTNEERGLCSCERSLLNDKCSRCGKTPKECDCFSLTVERAVEEALASHAINSLNSLLAIVEKMGTHRWYSCSHAVRGFCDHWTFKRKQLPDKGWFKRKTRGARGRYRIAPTPQWCYACPAFRNKGTV